MVQFEQLKKEQQKKGKKAGGKKKTEDKAASATEPKAEEAPAVEETQEGTTAEEDDPTAGDGETEKPAEVEKQPSLSLQSKQRSESFRQSGPLSPSLEVQDLYRKQAARIEELEKENKAFKEQQDEGAARLSKAEEELEGLREGSSDVADLRSKAKEAERLQTELASTQRQLSQAQQAAKGAARRASGPDQDLSEQLASKTSTIESLELEISNLRNQVTGLQTAATEHDTSTRELEERAKAAETATESVKAELDALKVSIAFPSDETKAANEDPEALTKRITVLESELRTANTDLDAAAKKASSLEQKIEALTKLHRDAASTSQAKDKELADLRNQLRRRDRGSHVRNVSDFELGEEETETGELQARIRALEAENFDLRRGVWRDKRAALQPGMADEDAAAAYEDVDLHGPYSPQGRRPTMGQQPQQHSTFQDVISSGISAFTGRTRDAPVQHDRKQSLGLLSDDGMDDFDPDAFRRAQEEEATKRLERIREVKRGLEEWRGWRVDLTEVRGAAGGGGAAFGEVFEI